MSFPLNYEASVNMGLTFLHLWNRITPTWLAKDIIVLFYDDYDAKSQTVGESYSKSVQEFLNNYFIGHSSFVEDNV